VLLYVDPEGQLGRGKVREGSQQRLLDALDHLIETDKNKAVLLLAHSQGSAIAADVLAKKHRDKIWFVSMGSPISSLYWRFMGPEAAVAPHIPWLNLFRTGDYIAGGEGIRRAWAPTSDVEDRTLGAGRHSNYFEDPKVWDAIGELLASIALSESSARDH
jgi:alpha-beta hydrolase superfamily lysophospholipase